MTQPAVILVTGSSRGLGRGVAETLAKKGFSVAIHYGFNEGAARDCADACAKLAPDAAQQFTPVRGDISDSAQRADLLRQTLDAFGRIDALVNNAGIAPRERRDITEATEQSFDELISTNLKGPYFLTQQVVNHWLGGGSGVSRLPGGYKVVFVTSISAYTASVLRGDYCISKAGLAMAAQLWATRLADTGIQVTELRPGIMATDMTSGVKEKYDALIAEGLVPMKRWGKPEDLGLAVSSVLTGHFPFSTGDVFNIDGGFHLRRL
jgi:NAD(P)-dependent dehydrogenase (short-subunit alcohol dehydrogenase family)